MSKMKPSMQTIVRYVRDLSIVIAGIAVTLYASDRVTGRGEKRDLKLYVNAIKIEMEENIKTLEEVIEYTQPSIRYSKYLWSHDKDSLNKDTVRSYLPVCYMSKSFIFKTNAFEMFKSSGTMRLVDDKDLLLSIWDIYAELINLSEMLDWCDHQKRDAMIKEFETIGVKNGMPDIQLDKAPMYSFYVMGLPQNMQSECEKFLTEAKAFVEKLYPGN